MSHFSRNIYAQFQWSLLHFKHLNKTCTTKEYVHLLGGKLVSKLAVFWIHTNTQVWIHDECLMNDLCNPVTYLWGFIVWLKQQPLAFPALAQLFNSCFVVGEDDWGAKWSRAQRGVKERPCSDQPQTTGLILPVEDSVVPLHALLYQRKNTYLAPLIQTPLCSPSQDTISLLNGPSHQREQTTRFGETWRSQPASQCNAQRCSLSNSLTNAFVFTRWMRTRACLDAKRHAVSSDGTRYISYPPMLRFPPNINVFCSFKGLS